MTKKEHKYRTLHKLLSLFMVLMLFWLNVSLAFVNPPSDLISDPTQTETNNPINDLEKDGSNSLPEEKNTFGISMPDEYLHDNNKSPYGFLNILIHTAFYRQDTYVAFHGELTTPPPDTC